MAKKIKLTTKTGYKNGYEAGLANQPRKSPHRVGTASEELWLAGYDAYISGDSPPEEPRKKRTKEEMAEAKNSPSDFNAPRKPLSPALMMNRNQYESHSVEPRGAGIMENLIDAMTELKDETDIELREILHMDVADLQWMVYAEDGPKPSTIWDEYKVSRELNFDRNAA